MAEDKKESPHSIKNALPSMRKISLRVLIAVAVVCLVLPLFGPFKRLAEPGPSSRAHAEISRDCKACHTLPFLKVSNSACESCHEMSAHGAAYAERSGKSPDTERRCADCHMEHNGAHGLMTRDSRECASCHANLGADHHEAKLKDVADLRSHLNFILPEIDKTALKLNHKVHLAEGIQGADGKVTLNCRDCHKLSADLKTVLPVKFEDNCQSCHGLTFDARLPGRTVPHGDADLVFRTLYAEYAQLALQGPQAFREPDVEATGRERPGESPEVRKIPLPSKLDESLVLKESRRIEQQLFEKTACYLCHDIKPRPDTNFDAAHSRYEVVKPKVPKTWMKHANFDHGAHEEVKCESCHEHSRESEKTSDVLLPQMDNCRQCHGDSEHGGKIQSDCSMCHSYHDSLPLSVEKKRTLQQILESSR